MYLLTIQVTGDRNVEVVFNFFLQLLVCRKINCLVSCFILILQCKWKILTLVTHLIFMVIAGAA